MRIFSKEDIRSVMKEIKRDSVFIYPTDTIYGIGCDATNEKAVKKIRKIKLRDEKPFSVIAPSKEWIKENCKVKDELDKLPGPYTLILKLKKNCVSKAVNLGMNTLGVRIPDHWFSKIVKVLGVPIVTTSVNKTGEKYMTCLDDLNPNIKKKIDFIIYEDKKEGRPSRIIKEGKIITR